MKKTPKISLIALLLAALTLAISCGKGFSNEKNISVVTREDGSGTKAAFMEILGLKGKSDVRGVIVAASTAALLTEVRGNPHSIGYESLGYVTDDVKPLKVDGVEPTPENIKNGSYKISRPLNIVYKEGNIIGAAAAFLSFLQSSDAKELITASGYVAPLDETSQYEPIPALSGEVTLSGSTSLQPLMVKLAALFEEKQGGVTVSVSGGGSGTGYKNAEGGVSDFGMISEAFVPSKAEKCVYYEVARDGIAIIVNKENPITDISLETLTAIYNSEKSSPSLKIWADVR